MVVSANEEGAQAEEELMTPEAQEHMLAEIRHKEAKASQLLKDAQAGEIQKEIDSSRFRYVRFLEQQKKGREKEKD